MFENKYPYTDFSQLNLDWFLNKFKELLEEQERVSGKVKDLDDTVKEFTDFVTNYFDNLDVQAEVNVKLNEMAADGTLSDLLAPLVSADIGDVVADQIGAVVGDQIGAVVGDQIDTVVADQIDAAVAPEIPGAVTDWLDANVSPTGTVVAVDSSLTIQGAAADAKAAGDALALCLKTYPRRIFDATDVSNILPDANNAENETIYALQMYNVTAPAHLPSGFPVDGAVRYLFTQTNEVLTQTQKTQYIFDEKWKLIYLRSYRSATDLWSDWQVFNSDYLTTQNKTIFNTQYEISDLNNAEVNSVYSIIKTSATNVSHFPADYPDDGSYATLTSYKSNHIGSHYIIMQVLQNYYHKTVWQRMYNSGYDTWGDWDKYSSEDTGGITVECGTGKQYTRLRDAVTAAKAIANSTVIVYPGEYDLTQEFASEIASMTTNKVGLELDNGIYLKFLAGSYVKALFPVSSDTISTYFNPFYGKNFTLDGLNIESSNCRYCVHDEQAGADVQYHNVYKNCIMKQTTSSESGVTGQLYVQCIGGGLGKNGYIEIIGGKYVSVSDIEATPSGELYNAISYHNGANNYADSKIFIRDVYIGDNNIIRFGYYGNSTIKSQILVSGCSMGGAIVVRQETPSGTQYPENFELTEWNNTVRT